MQMQCAIFSLILLIASNVLGQTNRVAHKYLPFLDLDSQSNIDVIENGIHPHPGPLKYTNLISNTNLFTLAEQQLLKQISVKYRHVTTNSGLPGAVFTGLVTSTNGLMACFQYTNADAKDLLSFPAMRSAKFRTKTGEGYDVDFGNADMYGISTVAFRQIKHDKMNGLFVKLYGDRCQFWMRFVDGRAVGKWLVWDLGGNLVIDAEFKRPYDFFKYARPIRM